MVPPGGDGGPRRREGLDLPERRIQELRGLRAQCSRQEIREDDLEDRDRQPGLQRVVVAREGIDRRRPDLRPRAHRRGSEVALRGKIGEFDRSKSVSPRGVRAMIRAWGRATVSSSDRLRWNSTS